MNFWRAQHQIHGQSLHERRLMVSSVRNCAQTDHNKDLLSVGVMSDSTDSASDNPLPLNYVADVSNPSLFIGSMKIPENNLGDAIDIRDHKLGGQFQLISTKAFQNSLCVRHNVQDSVELLSTESDSSLQVGVFAGVGLALPIQVNHDESSRGLRRVGQLPLRKLKIAREKKKEEERRRRKDVGDIAFLTLTTETNKELASELTVEENQKVKIEVKASDILKENQLNLFEEEAGDVHEKEMQDEQQEGTKDELKQQVKTKPGAPEELVEPPMQLGLSRVVFQPMNFALSRFTDGQRNVIAMIDQMMEESHLVWLGPSAWCEKP